MDTNIKMEVVVLVQVMKVLFKHQFSSILPKTRPMHHCVVQIIVNVTTKNRN